MLKLFYKFGRELFLAGINASHSGNISIRAGNKLFITRTGAMLADIQDGDIVETDIDAENINIASREIIVHRSIYKNTDAKAIIHSHPPYTISLSLISDEITPIDSEGNYFLNDVPVISTKQTIGSEEVAKKIPGAINKNGKIAVLKSHGSFSIGQNLEEALLWTSTLEKSAQIIYLTRTMSKFHYNKQLNYLKRKNKKKI